jgi:hypothetical protein
MTESVVAIPRVGESEAKVGCSKAWLSPPTHAFMVAARTILSREKNKLFSLKSDHPQGKH